MSRRPRPLIWTSQESADGTGYSPLVIDGGIDTDFIKQMRDDQYADLKAKDGILNPEAIAENDWLLHQQPRSAWTHELDLRPWMEKW